MAVRLLGILLCAALFPARADAQSAARDRPRPIAVGFQTEDGIRIKADFARPRGAKPVVVMLHGVAAGRREWDPLVAELRLLGFGTLQLDEIAIEIEALRIGPNADALLRPTLPRPILRMFTLEEQGLRHVLTTSSIEGRNSTTSTSIRRCWRLAAKSSADRSS